MLKILYIFLFFGLFITNYGWSQRKNEYNQNIKMFKADRVLLTWNYLHWQNLPSEISLTSLNRGFYLGYFIDNPIGGSRISLGFGASLSTSNLYSDAIPTYLIDGDCSLTDFVKIKDICNTAGTFKHNKMSFTYVSIPLEIRLRLGKNEKIKFAIGGEFGYLVSSFVKYRGPNIFQKTNDEIKFKYYKIENAADWRYGLSFRGGYDRFSLRVFYPLTTNFIAGKGVNLFPIEIGLSLMVF